MLASGGVDSFTMFHSESSRSSAHIPLLAQDEEAGTQHSTQHPPLLSLASSALAPLCPWSAWHVEEIALPGGDRGTVPIRLHRRSQVAGYRRTE
jgi:hypothetical protein